MRKANDNNNNPPFALPQAVRLSPDFAFASSNLAAAEFAAGQRQPAERRLRSLLRRYPGFADARAALTGLLWASGREAEAEEEWGRVEDPRYSSVAWLRFGRRWPPPLIDALAGYLTLRSALAP